jgi:hypothetical protein
VEDLAHSSASDGEHVSRLPKTKPRRISKVSALLPLLKKFLLMYSNVFNQKQELVENARERSRAAAAQHVSIPRIEVNKYSIQSFLNKLK